MESSTCPVCSHPADFRTERFGNFAKRSFHVYECPSCGFIFVGDPWTDYPAIYTVDYYEGKGIDPLISYTDELTNPRILRRLEWNGILSWAKALMVVDESTKWLDYGAGSGGLVRYLRGRGYQSVVGYEPSDDAPSWLQEADASISEESMATFAHSFDIITAIEVLEHTTNPIDELRRMHSLLKPGGLLLMTTTNVAPYRKRLSKWRYIIPEIHVSFFDPDALSVAMESAGFRPSLEGYTAGWTDIIRYKFLKNIGAKGDRWWHGLLPWPLLCRLIDSRLHLSAQPVGRA